MPDPKDPDDEPTAEHAADADVTTETGPETSGSVDVAMSDSRLVPVPEEKSSRFKRTSQYAVEKVEDVVSSGVGKIGAGVGAIGGGLSKLGARVDKLPGMHSTKLGTGVIELGAGISELGASLTDLPKVARTRRGRVLVRSLIVGFLLVFAWVSVIIYLQVRGGEKPDLRPRAEQIMIELRDSPDRYRKFFDEASPRFQEISDYESFARTMEDMNRTLGKFREIAAINDTIVTRSQGGTIVRVDMMLDFEKGRARGTVSLQRDHGMWKFLGIGVDLPDALIAKETSPEARIDRVKAPAEVRKTAETILGMLRDQQAGEVWDGAAKLFQQFVTRADFARIEDERRATLGRYIRILEETPTEKPRGATTPGGSYSWFSALAEYERAVVSTTFGFYLIDGQWKLSSYVVVLPMPRAPRTPGEAPADASSPDAAPADASPRR